MPKSGCLSYNKWRWMINGNCIGHGVNDIGMNRGKRKGLHLNYPTHVFSCCVCPHIASLCGLAYPPAFPGGGHIVLSAEVAAIEVDVDGEIVGKGGCKCIKKKPFFSLPSVNPVHPQLWLHSTVYRLIWKLSSKIFCCEISQKIPKIPPKSP